MYIRANFNSFDIRRIYCFVLLGVICFVLSACSNKKNYTKHKQDPLQPINRVVYGFNNVVDNLYIRPVADVYSHVMPPPGQAAVANFLNNVSEVPNTFNGVLQGKFKQAFNDSTRFVINSTFGVLGLFDVANGVGLPAHKEDFGQTLSYWGYKNSAYLVLPILI